MNRRKISLLLNILIVILEIIGLIISVNIHHRLSIEYYTVDSNILALISSLIFTTYLMKKKEIPGWLKTFKYSTTICLTITFVVVIFILAPTYNFNYNLLLFHEELLYQHFLCPILGIISFIFFDKYENFTRKENILGMNLTLVYGIIILILNILDIVVGPYPFLMIKKQSALTSILWIIIILSIAYLIAYTLRKLYNIINNSNKKTKYN